MRDSINYNLKYFIMKMSGTKPMKNTMRKPSPLKFDSVIAASLATKEGKASYEASRPKGTTKPVEGKPSSKPAAPRGPLARAKAKAAVSSRTTKKEATETSIKTKAPAAKSTTETSVKTKATATKPAKVEVKPSAKPSTSKGAFAGAASKAAEIASKATPMKMKKSGMSKKC